MCSQTSPDSPESTGSQTVSRPPHAGCPAVITGTGQRPTMLVRCGQAGKSVLIQGAWLQTLSHSDRLIRLKFLMLICSQMKRSVELLWNYPSVEEIGFSALRSSVNTEVLTGTEIRNEGSLVRTVVLGKTAISASELTKASVPPWASIHPNVPTNLFP